MIVYFVISIVNSMSQSYHKRRTRLSMSEPDKCFWLLELRGVYMALLVVRTYRCWTLCRIMHFVCVSVLIEPRVSIFQPVCTRYAPPFSRKIWRCSLEQCSAMSHAPGLVSGDVIFRKTLTDHEYNRQDLHCSSRGKEVVSLCPYISFPVMHCLPN